MGAVHEALFYDKLPGNEVLCRLCPHDCRIRNGGGGACGVRFNDRGKLFTVVYDEVVSQEIDPVEKKPLFHFFPGSLAWSIATVGCNMACAFCQNWPIAQWPKEMLPRRLDQRATPPTRPVRIDLADVARQVVGERITPEEIVRNALEAGCASMAYTYTEPTVFFELAWDTAVRARESGLKNIRRTSLPSGPTSASKRWPTSSSNAASAARRSSTPRGAPSGSFPGPTFWASGCTWATRRRPWAQAARSATIMTASRSGPASTRRRCRRPRWPTP